MECHRLEKDGVTLAEYVLFTSGVLVMYDYASGLNPVVVHKNGDSQLAVFKKRFGDGLKRVCYEQTFASDTA